MRLTYDAAPPRDSTTDELDAHYATNVESRDAVDFVQKHRDDTKPYFLEVATYAAARAAAARPTPTTRRSRRRSPTGRRRATRPAATAV